MIRDVTYPLVMGLVKMWRAFTYVVYFVLQAPLKTLAKKEFQDAGIEINGTAPHDIQIHNEMFYRRVNQDGILGVAESYMDGWIDIDSIDEFFHRLILKGIYKKYFRLPWHKLCHYLEFELFNQQTAKRSFEVGEKHYDKGNALFESFLDKSMNYSCGYWKNAKNLDEAQENKMELIARKLKLEPGMKVLDIGCASHVRATKKARWSTSLSFFPGSVELVRMRRVMRGKKGVVEIFTSPECTREDQISLIFPSELFASLMTQTTSLKRPSTVD
ncbi:unnamed protein product [Allacma fusca]|uniref:Cyclopropane-fatty-acyl-phospholipid synthase n=1 Tax=Allacma fusca TaxID=39272 RepID=A0A8J2KSN4_9HEXA|nr:unnamed protein product [Allacma fusca]